VAQVLGLAGEVLLPVPFVQKLAREGVAVGPALRIEARAGIAVPVPGAAEVAAGLEHGGLDAEVEQALDLVDAGDARADDDGFVVLCHGGQSGMKCTERQPAPGSTGSAFSPHHPVIPR